MSDVGDWIGVLVHGHETEWITGISGALGALTGAFVSVVWTEFFNQRTRKRDRKERLATGAFAVYQKLNLIYSLTISQSSVMNAEITRARGENSPFLTTLVRPIFRSVGNVEFTIEELWAITAVGGSELVNKVNSLDIRFNQESQLMRVYSADRREVMALMPPLSVTGDVGHVEMSAAELIRIQPRLVELDGILLQAQEMAQQLAQDSFEALKALVYARDKPLGQEFSITLPDLDGTLTTISAVDAPRHWDWFLGVPYRTRLEPSVWNPAPAAPWWHFW